MQKKARMIALLVALIFLLGSVMPVGAFDGFKTLKAQFKNYKLVVDGRQLVTQDEPFIVDGRTYVPVRVIAEATGAAVDWDGANGRVLIATNKSQAEQRYQDGYNAGLKAGELNGYWRGLQEAQNQLADEASKKKEYESGYKDGEAKGNIDGFAAGENDFERGRKSDWSRAIDTDTNISRTYRLSGKTDEYTKGFLEGYQVEFKAAYLDGYDSYGQYDDGYEDGYWDGYYDGYRQGKSDSDRNRNYNDMAPTSRSIISEYRLESKSKNYRDAFVDGYWKNYSRGYADGFDGKTEDPYRK